MQLVLLEEKHLAHLFDFELENRAYFETLIESRGDDFYRKPAILEHIKQLIADYNIGEKYSCLVLKDEKVLARANIKSIDDERATAEVGYRVAENSAGQGVASFALKSLIHVAKTQLGLKSLTAWVMGNNPASARVLEKQGFLPQQKIQNAYYFDGRYLATTEYCLQLDE